MKPLTITLIAAALLVGGCGGSSGSRTAAGHGHVNIVMWEGYTETEAVAIKDLAAEFNA